MTGYGRDREARRVQSSLLAALSTASAVAALAFKIGLLTVLVPTAALLVAAYGVVTAIMWRGWRVELRRRASGGAPSWSAQLPIVVARQLGATASGRHSAESRRGGRQEYGEYWGRLTLLDEELRWEPRAGDRARGVGPITWDHSWCADVVPIWGPGSQGCLTLTHDDGTAVDIWIRHPGDLSRTLGLAGSR